MVLKVRDVMAGIEHRILPEWIVDVVELRRTASRTFGGVGGRRESRRRLYLW
jgi:hypothetical protein